MEDFNKKMKEIEKEIKEIDEQLNILSEMAQENIVGGEIPFGLFSIKDNRVKLELLLEATLFDEGDLKKLEQMAQEMQDLLIKIYNK